MKKKADVMEADSQSMASADDGEYSQQLRSGAFAAMRMHACTHACMPHAHLAHARACTPYARTLQHRLCAMHIAARHTHAVHTPHTCTHMAHIHRRQWCEGWLRIIRVDR